MTVELVEEKVVILKRCESPNHWHDIIILGECAKCHHGMAKFEEDKEEKEDKDATN
jgi:hypothetical protein